MQSVDGHFDEVILTDGTRTARLEGELPYVGSGLHWRTATHRVETAQTFLGERARGVCDDEVVYNGHVDEIIIRETNDMAVLFVEPPDSDLDDATRETLTDLSPTTTT